MSVNFVEHFRRHKRVFLGRCLEDVAAGDITEDELEKRKAVLEQFEKWLQRMEEAGKEVGGEAGKDADDFSFDQFLDEVLARAQEILAQKGIRMYYTSLSREIGVSESWKCIRVFGSNVVYYRIGRTRPRKGPNAGREFLVIDLVMDGRKKQVFVPILKRKDNIEKELGATLERELPRVEATGKYRLKLMLPYEVVRERNIQMAARRLADFIMATKPHLNELGVV